VTAAQDGNAEARRTIVERFRWIDGHADLWSVFADGPALRLIVSQLAAPFRGAVDAVIGVEARGFLLGAAAALEIGVGFVAVRKPGGLFPGPKLTRQTDADYRGRRTTLALRTHDVSAAQRLLFVDDWAETGSTLRAVASMVAAQGASVVAASVVVDQLGPPPHGSLPPVHSLVSARDLAD
jgi:adenine phosphoribosyltransferase